MTDSTLVPRLTAELKRLVEFIEGEYPSSYWDAYVGDARALIAEVEVSRYVCEDGDGAEIPCVPVSEGFRLGVTDVCMSANDLARKRPFKVYEVRGGTRTHVATISDIQVNGRDPRDPQLVGKLPTPHPPATYHDDGWNPDDPLDDDMAKLYGLAP